MALSDFTVKYGCAQSLGARDSQEDRLAAVPSVGAALQLPHLNPVGFFAVFDGHMGWSAAEFAQKNLLPNIVTNSTIATDPIEAIRQGFSVTDQQYIGPPPPPDQLAPLGYIAGTTVASALIDFSRRRMLVASVGDSRVVLCRAGVAHALTRDHTCSMLSEEEKQSVSKTGSSAVIGSHMWISVPTNCSGSQAQRFSARGSSISLEVTRALGDPLFKRMYNPTIMGAGRDLVSNEPDIADVALDDDCEFVLIASDGLFGVFSNEECVAIARPFLDPQQAAEALVQEATARQCSDNVTVVVFRCK